MPWWRGPRGEWYVVAQLVLMALVLFGPRTPAGLPAWPAPVAQIARVVGILFMIAGACFLFFGIFRLGPSLTPLPYPREKAKLIEDRSDVIWELPGTTDEF